MRSHSVQHHDCNQKLNSDLAPPPTMASWVKSHCLKVNTFVLSLQLVLSLQEVIVSMAIKISFCIRETRSKFERAQESKLRFNFCKLMCNNQICAGSFFAFSNKCAGHAQIIFCHWKTLLPSINLHQKAPRDCKCTQISIADCQISSQADSHHLNCICLGRASCPTVNCTFKPPCHPLEARDPLETHGTCA